MISLCIMLILGALIGVFAAIVEWTEERNRGSHYHQTEQSQTTNRRSSHCDGDCANCPPHYGYRHGRWHYGHGHIEGCTRGGNGGSSGKCRRW